MRCVIEIKLPIDIRLFGITSYDYHCRVITAICL